LFILVPALSATATPPLASAIDVQGASDRRPIAEVAVYEIVVVLTDALVWVPNVDTAGAARDLVAADREYRIGIGRASALCKPGIRLLIRRIGCGPASNEHEQQG
jgi:hypothetical protein